MWSYYIWSLTLFTFTFSNAKIFKEGGTCTLDNGKIGKCKKLFDCKQDYVAVFANNKPKLPPKCDSEFRLYCCDDFSTKIRPGETGNKPTATLRSDKVSGLKSKEKCKYYSKLLDSSEKVGSACSSIATKIIGGTKASALEFPHMAQWGYFIGSEPNYVCGASLISENFLLTAAHCQKTSDARFVARLSSDDRKSQIIVKIAERIPHPLYISTKHYNDIALLRLEKPVKFSKYVRPACLQADSDIKQKTAIASGWGRTSEEGRSSGSLLKVTLPLLDISKCASTYTIDEYPTALSRDVDKNAMLCAGGRNLYKDTCKGDSGGPLQIRNEKLNCMYNIIGVTSFGKKCGTVPGVYTKVSKYIQWIESIVWPDKE